MKTFWQEVAEHGTIDDVREMILSGYKEGKPFAPDNLLLRWPFAHRGHTILDFGCGLGRNWPLLRPKCSMLYYHDTPEMRDRMFAHTTRYLDVAWNQTPPHVDVVYASLVLQHLHRRDWSFLDLSHAFLYVYGRARHDHSAHSTFSLIPSHYYCMAAYNHSALRYTSYLDLVSDTSEHHYEAIFRREPTR